MSGSMPNDPAVAAAFEAYPPEARRRLLRVRRLILDVAKADAAIGPLTETLKWGEPAYLTEATRSGSTLRIAWKAGAPEQYALYVHCQTPLIDSFRTLFPEQTFEGNRAIVFEVAKPVPSDVIRQCAELTLTYHRRKHTRRRARNAPTA